jgi:segregation and condensation protein B
VTDERPESLAAQAASWIPPWERAPREPDRGYQAAAEAAGDGVDEPSAAVDEPDPADQPDAGEEVDEAGLSDDDDDFDESFEGPNPAGYAEEVPTELAALPGEVDGPATVDAPQELPAAAPADATDVAGGSELPLPPAIEEASTEHADAGLPVDAPMSADGDDAGEVFDLAADDDVSDDEDLDLAVTELVADEDEDDAAASPEVAEASSSPDGGAGSGRRERSEPGIPAQGRGSGGSGAAGGEPGQRSEAEVSPMADSELRAALEAILLVVDEPVAEMQLAQIMEQPTERIARMLEDISARYTAAGHGFDLRRAAGGWRLYTRPEYAPYVERFVLDGQSVRLTQAALETVAVVAYKQPVTRSRISAIRGVNCDGVMRTLVTRGLIEECGTESETGAFLYRTTPLFLEKLGLNSVDQLPPLAPFLPDDVEEVLDASG